MPGNNNNNNNNNAPACRGQSRLSGFCCAHRLCVRSPCQHISRMRTFDNNSCAISITSPRSIFVPGTQHVWWGRREKSRRASTRCDCRGKSRLAGLSPLSGTPSERGVSLTQLIPHIALGTASALGPLGHKNKSLVLCSCSFFFVGS